MLAGKKSLNETQIPVFFFFFCFVSFVYFLCVLSRATFIYFINFTATGVKCRAADVKCLPVLHQNAVFIFLGIVKLILV